MTVADDAGAGADFISGIARKTGAVGHISIAKGIDRDAFIVGTKVIAS